MNLNRLSRVFSYRDQKQTGGLDQLLGEELKCPICLEISREPVTTNCCGSVFCESCIKKLLAQKCPKCNKQQFTFQKNLLATRLVNQYPIQCKFGCGHQFGGSEIENHENVCPLRTITCKICSLSSTYNEFIQHVVDQHRKEIVQTFEKR